MAHFSRGLIQKSPYNNVLSSKGNYSAMLMKKDQFDKLIAASNLKYSDYPTKVAAWVLVSL